MSGKYIIHGHMIYKDDGVSSRHGTLCNFRIYYVDMTSEFTECYQGLYLNYSLYYGKFNMKCMKSFAKYTNCHKAHIGTEVCRFTTIKSG
uniref:Uncharacterized protein n=1 Tax=viral metagenome TaxID=1070528 RepID=A0A6C0CM25_9ZZZZ